MAGKRKTLDPKLDIVFFMLFGEERNRALLLSLINAVLQPPVPIAQAEVVRPEPERLFAGDKSIALDVRVQLSNGERVDLEMQTQAHPALRERLLYYWARLYAGQLLRGDEYLNLRRCAVIVFANFEMLAGPRFHSLFRLEERHSRELLSPQLEIHILELPKLAGALDREDEPNLTLWAKFLSAGNDTDLEALAMQHPVIKQAKDALDELSDDPKARIQAEMREMALISYNLGLGAAREEGIEQGRAEGKVEALRTLLTLKFGALPDGVTKRLQVASDAQLQTWLEAVLSAARLDDILSTS